MSRLASIRKPAAESARKRKVWLHLPTMAAVFLVSFAGVSYYAHVVRGGLGLLVGRQPIAKILQNSDTPSELKAKLGAALEARDFASDELLLPQNNSYRKYKDLGRPYASWTVMAAPEFSLQPVTWCFPVAGCVSYRGYFSPERAEEFGEELRQQGYDVDVGGVRAYSSLGWFADPVLNTFLKMSDTNLAGLIFHELAHQKLYVKGDTAFNEAFATVVESEGVRRWLDTSGNTEAIGRHRRSAEIEKQFIELARVARERLESIYSADESDEWKRSRKAQELDRVRQDYEELKESWGGLGWYDDWFGDGLNNARLMAVGAYHDHEPALRAVLDDCSIDLECFYTKSAELGEMSFEQRAERLSQLASGLQSDPS